MTDVGTIIAAVGTSLTVVLVNFFAWKGRNRFVDLKKLISEVDIKHEIGLEALRLAQLEISTLFSTEKELISIGNDSKKVVDQSDRQMLLFISVCVGVTITFYKELTTDDVIMRTPNDIYRASNKSIDIIQTASKKFDDEFIDIFWKTFTDNSIQVQKDIIKMIDDPHNRKEKRFIEIIKKYLSDQLIYVTTERIKYLAKQ